MRFGLAGTGPWAQMAHGPGLLASDDVDLIGVWGRDLKKAELLAEDLGVAAYDDFEAMLADVDAVAFALPPETQAALAQVAAKAGKHVLLDKPIALTVDSARALADAVNDSGVASVVFFTDRFPASSRAWFAEAAETGGWKGGWLQWFSALQQPDNPFGGSLWRHEQGALWDTGPHALSTLSTALGPIVDLTAVGGAGDLVTLVLRHEGGASSIVVLTQFAPPNATLFEAKIWGEAGINPMPPRPDGMVDLIAIAAGDLVKAATSGVPAEVDVNFGARVVDLLAQAQAQLTQSSPL